MPRLRRILLFTLLILLIAIVSILVMATVPARNAARALRLASSVTAGVTDLGEFRKRFDSAGVGSLTCNATNCYYSFVTSTRFLSQLSHPSSLSVEVWFENSIATKTQILFMVGEFGGHAFVNVFDWPKPLNCVTPCATMTKSGLMISVDPNTPPEMRKKAFELNTNCLWLKIGCSNLNEAYPSAPLFIELARQRSLREWEKYKYEKR